MANLGVLAAPRNANSLALPLVNLLPNTKLRKTTTHDNHRIQPNDWRHQYA